jgi:hypothetical protein
MRAECHCCATHGNPGVKTIVWLDHARQLGEQPQLCDECAAKEMAAIADAINSVTDFTTETAMALFQLSEGLRAAGYGDELNALLQGTPVVITYWTHDGLERATLSVKGGKPMSQEELIECLYPAFVQRVLTSNDGQVIEE